MRILLALILTMVPALAQQADPSSKAADPASQTSAQAGAKAGDQASAPASAAPSTPAAPSPVPSGAPWFMGSVDLGYRWLVGNSGSFPEYRSVVNLGQGLVLNGLDFTILDPKHRYFDRIDANADGWGGEPYESAHFNIRKQGAYDFLFDLRDIALFDAVPSYANPAAPGGFNEQSFDTRIRNLSVGIDLRPGKRIIPYFVFDRSSQSGNGIDEWVQDSNNSYPVPVFLSDRTNLYRGGVRFEFNRWHVTLEQGGTTYEDNDQTNYTGNNTGDRTTPLFGQTLLLTGLQQAYNITGSSRFSKALLTAHPFSWIDIYGQFLFSEPKTTVNFNENAAGNFVSLTQLLFYSSQQTIGTGAANQPHTTGTAGFEIRPLKRVRVLQNWTTDQFHDAAFGMATITPTTATGGGVTALNPLQTVNYNQEQVDVMYDATEKLTFRGGYRHVWGDTTTPATPFLNSPNTLEHDQLDRNVGLAGINFRFSEKMTFNADYEGGVSDDIYFRESLNNYQKVRARARYRLLPSLSLLATATYFKNTNPAPSIQYNVLARDNSLGVFWTPKNGKHFTLNGQYDRGTMHSRIDYLNLPFYTPTVSDYRDNSHVVTGLVDIALPRRLAAKLSMGGSMLVSNGSNTTRYYQPLARLSVPLWKHVAWNAEWKYYGYQESFYLYQGFRAHLFMTGLKFSR